MTYVWTYWEGPRIPYIDVCLNSLSYICNNPEIEFQLLTPDNVQDYLDFQDLHPNYQKLPQAALKADCIRAALLAKYGGFWWDADTIGIRSPHSLIERYTKATAIYSVWSKPPLRVFNGYIYLAPDSIVGQEWLGKVNSTLAQDSQEVRWCDLGEKLLTRILPGQSGCNLIDRRIFLPIDIDSDVRWFFKPGNFHRYLIPETVCFGLNHSWFLYHQQPAMNLSSAAWSKSPLLIHQLLHFAQERFN